jgi:hypothetical protein
VRRRSDAPQPPLPAKGVRRSRAALDDTLAILFKEVAELEQQVLTEAGRAETWEAHQ